MNTEKQTETAPKTARVPARPSEKAWAAAVAEGEQAIHRALVDLSARHLSKPAGNALVHAAAIGCLVELGCFISDMANPAARHMAEAYALAHLRGVMRGAEGPINDNGTPFTGASDA